MTAARKLEAEKPPVVDDDDALDPREQAEINEAWEAEINRRIAEVESGAVQLIPWEEVEAKIKAKYGWA